MPALCIVIAHGINGSLVPGPNERHSASSLRHSHDRQLSVVGEDAQRKRGQRVAGEITANAPPQHKLYLQFTLCASAHADAGSSQSSMSDLRLSDPHFSQRSIAVENAGRQIREAVAVQVPGLDTRQHTLSGKKCLCLPSPQKGKTERERTMLPPSTTVAAFPALAYRIWRLLSATKTSCDKVVRLLLDRSLQHSPLTSTR